MSELFPGSEFEVVSEMHRRHSDILVLESAEQGRYVAKFEAGWSKSVLEVLASNAEVLHGALATEGSRLDVVRIVGQTQDPPGLIMEYVAGVNLSSLIARAVLCSATPGDRREAQELVALAGSALGTIHSTAGVLQSETTLLDRIQRRFKLPKSWVKDASRSICPVRSVRDFAPYNLRVTPDDGLCILDIASESKIVTAHEDCALFLAGLSRCVYEVQWRHRDWQHRVFEDLRRSFMAGYSSSGPIDLRDPKQETLLDWALAYTISNILIKLARRPSRTEYLSLVRLAPLLWPTFRRRAKAVPSQLRHRSDPS